MDRPRAIVCGYGRLGRAVARALAARGIPFVVVERDSKRCALLSGKGLPFVRGNPLCESTLVHAGVRHAESLIATIDSDSDSARICLRARRLNPGILLIARARAPECAAVLRRAGADEVVCPEAEAGRQLASMALKGDHQPPKAWNGRWRAL